MVKAKNRLILAEQNLEAIDLLGTKLKNKEAVEELIEYVQDWRVDSIREAVNLFFEEQHRNKLETFVEEQVKLTEEAKKLAEQAAEQASRSADNSRRAEEKAQEAMNKACDALKQAERAYDKVNMLINTWHDNNIC